jgi:hypothetical protein
MSRADRSVSRNPHKSLLAFAIIFFAFLPWEGLAQSVCGPRAEMLKQLAAQYQEGPVGLGLAKQRRRDRASDFGP